MSVSALSITPEILYSKHQLSYQQIDSILATDHISEYNKDLMNGLLMVRELILMIDLFQQQEIKFIPLKGPVLSFRIYDDATIRRCHDLDFLIDFQQLNEINDVLQNQGYKPEFILNTDRKSRKRLFFRSKDLKYVNHQKKIVVELHWRLFTYDIFGKYDTIESLSRFVSEIQFMNRQLNVFNPEFELLYIILHGSTHKWSILKWLIDINDYLKHVKFDSERFNNLATKCYCNRVLALYNHIAERYIDHPELFRVDSNVPAVLIANCIHEIEEKKYSSETFAVKLSKSLNKLRYQYQLIPCLQRRFFLFSRYFRRDFLKGINSGL